MKSNQTSTNASGVVVSADIQKQIAKDIVDIKTLLKDDKEFDDEINYSKNSKFKY